MHFGKFSFGSLEIDGARADPGGGRISPPSNAIPPH